MDDIIYDTPIEVTEKQYNAVMKEFKGLIAHRKDEVTGQRYIKLWYPKYAPFLKIILEQNLT
jgi:hypothetical protein